MTGEKNFPGGRGELRTYKSGKTYRKKLPEERLIGINKPDDPRAVRFHGKWFLPLEVIPITSNRVMPETRPDELAYDHIATRKFGCSCDVCQRPQAERWRRKWRREQGLHTS